MKDRVLWKLLTVFLCSMLQPSAFAGTSSEAQQKLSKLLLGQQVKTLIELPATKEGINIYYQPEAGKRTDEHGVDMKSLTKYLKSKGVGVEANETDVITDVKFDKDRVELHVGGGGEGRRGSKHAEKISPGYKRAGGSRINFHYQREIADSDIQPDSFLRFMERILDVSAIRLQLTAEQLPPELKAAVQAKTVKEGMTYQMVLMSFGDPDQKKINDSTDSGLSETWYYLKDAHRWVVDFQNGKVSKVRVY